MVPSLTEMLIDAGVNVVGRTRFCIHPETEVVKIPVVGGTKDINWDKVNELSPDLLIFDREENPLSFAEESPFPFHATHVTSVHDLEKTCRELSELFQNEKLKEVAERWRLACKARYFWDFADIPGAITEINSSLQQKAKNSSHITQLVYVIWRNPWMAAGQNTFIGSVLELLGAKGLNLFVSEKYPRFELSQLSLETCYFLFSSEPFPFAQKIGELEKLGVCGSVVDGESYSWFGIRTLQFLEKQKK